MANRLNDTDPQSPRAFTRTDPGLGEVVAPECEIALRTEPSPVPPAMAQAPASIEDLIDGITGPRPPLTPEPALYGMAPPRPARELEVPQRVELDSTRPVVQKPAEELTVHTGRRALVRNLAVVVASSAAVALMMVTIMRWKEAHRVRRPLEVVVLPAVPDETAAGAVNVTDVAPVLAEPVPVEVVPVASAASVVGAPAASVARPASSAQKRAGAAKATARSAAELDDLNRQISH